MSDSLDRELEDHPAALRWRLWMGRVEAVIFASRDPTPRTTLALVVGDACNLDVLIADIQRELTGRPYELVEVAGGFQHRTRPDYAMAIHAAGIARLPQPDLTQRDLTVLMAVACFQPITRADLSSILGKAVSRDTISVLTRKGLIAAGPRSPQPGAPYTYVTTLRFLQEFGFKSLSELPDLDKLREAGLLDRQRIAEEEDPITRLDEGDDDPDGPSFAAPS